jgi:hypothetical protein
MRMLKNFITFPKGPQLSRHVKIINILVILSFISNFERNVITWIDSTGAGLTLLKVKDFLLMTLLDPKEEQVVLKPWSCDDHQILYVKWEMMLPWYAVIQITVFLFYVYSVKFSFIKSSSLGQRRKSHCGFDTRNKLTDYKRQILYMKFVFNASVSNSTL